MYVHLSYLMYFRNNLTCRGSGAALTQSTSGHDRSELANHNHRQNSKGNGLNTLATTTGSHNYEIPLDDG